MEAREIFGTTRLDSPGLPVPARLSWHTVYFGRNGEKYYFFFKGVLSQRKLFLSLHCQLLVKFFIHRINRTKL
jgi:hypothetical protein